MIFKSAESFFFEIGIELIKGENSKYYPMSLQASCVSTLLTYEAKRLGVEFVFNSEIEFIKKKKNSFYIGTKAYDKVLIATGSIATYSLGGSNLGYKIAKNFNHTIIKPIPSLVQLISNAPFLKKIAGVKLNATVKILVDKKLKATSNGDLLFTNYGLSGLAILDVSRVVSVALEKKRVVEANLDLFPNFTKEQLTSLLQKRLKYENKKDIDLWLEGLINKKLIKIIIKESKIDKTFAKDLSKKDLNILAYTLKNFIFKIADTKGFKSCEVVAGGVDTKEINPKTMESKLVKNLFFCGEVLDVDGDRGGYNLHFAWASGYIAGCTM